MPILQRFAGRQNSERHHAGVASCPCYMMLGWTLRSWRESPAKVLCELSPWGMTFRGPTGLSTGSASWLDFCLWEFSFLLIKINFPCWYFLLVAIWWVVELPSGTGSCKAVSGMLPNTDFGERWDEKRLQIWRDAKDTLKPVISVWNGKLLKTKHFLWIRESH